MRQLMLMRNKRFARPVSEGLSCAQVDVDKELIDGRRKRRKLNPAQRKVRPAVLECDVEFIVQAFCSDQVLDCLLELSVCLATYAEQPAITPKR